MLFNKLVLSTETGVMLEVGGINDQPDWFMEQFAWFAPAYKNAKLMQLMNKVMGAMPALSARGKRDNPGTAARKR